MHLFGFIIRISHDARSLERQKKIVLQAVYFRVGLAKFRFALATIRYARQYQSQGG